MFLQASVILSTGGGLPQCMLGYHPPEQTPPGADTPWEQTNPRQTPPRADPQEQTSPEADTPPEQTPPGSRLRHTVNEWPVRILLECILVFVFQFKKDYRLFCDIPVFSKYLLFSTFKNIIVQIYGCL